MRQWLAGAQQAEGPGAVRMPEVRQPRGIRLFVGCIVAAALLVVAVSRVQASGLVTSTYVNPFAVAGESWGPARTDMGVDYFPYRKEAVVAIGNAQILGSRNHANWPSGHLIWYRLLDGNHAGDIIYVSEHLRKMVPAGRVVAAGQRIAQAIPGYPWTEWGWATPSGKTRAMPCYREGVATNSGMEMARFLLSLGAQVLEPPGPGPNRPFGKRC